MRDILSGNEALARGAWEAGVRLATAYPGTPSTEILENLARYEGVHAQWSPNEKVAFEVALGGALAGDRSLVAMKHVGLNVAADPLFTASYTGINGGLVLVTADDPALHSSQNEQDNRNYAKFAKVPLLEPSDSQEAKDFVRLALRLSEDYDTPVIIRTTTRISHSKSVVALGDREETEVPTGLEKNAPKWTMLPAFAKPKHPWVEERLRLLADWADRFSGNRIEMGDPSVGIVAAGAAYQYAREAFPRASFLKLGLTYPLPERLLQDFRSRVERLYVVEELDPFLEEQIRLLSLEVDGGKDLLPQCGELDPGLVARALDGAGIPGAEPDLLHPPAAEAAGLPLRPPTLCPGCGHRGLFTVLSRLRVFVSGDIGCYTLGALPPMEAMHTCVCMGASIGMAHGISRVMPDTGRLRDRAVAVIGDSTFFHSGVTGLMDIVWNQGNTVTIILDNRTVGMTGGQETPGSGRTLKGEETVQVDLVKLAEALGIRRATEVDAYDLKEIERTLRRELAAGEPSLVVVHAPCVLRFRITRDPWTIDPDLCTGCKRCLQVACTALSLVETGEKQIVEIAADQCNGCGICAQLCKLEAITAPQPVSGLRRTE